MPDLEQIVHVEEGVRYSLDTDDTMRFSVMAFRHRGAGDVPFVLCGPTTGDLARIGEAHEEHGLDPIFTAAQARSIAAALLVAADLAEGKVG